MDTLIEDLTEAALSAIEQAAAEAAKAAAIASLEREAAAIAEAARWERNYREEKGRTVRTVVITGVICFFGGVVVGAGSSLLMRN